jgi:sulfur carrier protein ThiS
VQVKVKLLLTFKENVPGGKNPFYLESDPGITASQALALLSIPPSEPKVILLNGRFSTEEQELKDGDTLTVFPPLEGG